MVWHAWADGCLYASASIDLYHWEAPTLLLKPTGDIEKTWYPTIIGESSFLAGRKARLYYSGFHAGKRSFFGRDIIFDKTAE